MSEPEPADLSIYDRLHWSDEQLTELLASGAQRRELQAYFGHADYERLAGLARFRAVHRGRAPRPRVYVIPGILGSELGIPRPAPWPPDLLWLDAIDIIRGRLTELGLDAPRGVVPLGVLPTTYLPLRLELEAAGCDVVMHAYDWRRSILDAGHELGERLAADPAPAIHVVAHSMGGLVARAALRHAGGARIARLITVATPHRGALAPLQALRGTYPVVRRLAALDLRHDAGQLAHEVFSTFPSLYEMLPPAGAMGELDLFDPSSWPAGQPAPDPDLLRAARALTAGLAPLDARCVAIVGVGQRTVIGVEREQEEFRYAVSGAGDGTVPASSAAATGIDHYYFRCEHSELTRSGTVARALLDLIARGATGRLQRSSALAHQPAISVTDADLRRVYNDKVDWHALSPEARRIYLQRLNEPPPQYLRRAARRGR